jgi:hypothetical protein
MSQRHISTRWPAPCSTSRWPPAAALEHVQSFQSHPLARTPCSTSRWLPFAANAHVPASQRHSLAHDHCSTSRLPCNASSLQVLASHVQPCCRSSCKYSSSQDAATAVAIAPCWLMVVSSIKKASHMQPQGSGCSSSSGLSCRQLVGDRPHESIQTAAG